MYDVISVIMAACFTLLSAVVCVGFIENCYDNWWWRKNSNTDDVSDVESTCENSNTDDVNDEESVCEEGEEITCEEHE